MFTLIFTALIYRWNPLLKYVTARATANALWELALFHLVVAKQMAAAPLRRTAAGINPLVSIRSPAN